MGIYKKKEGKVSQITSLTVPYQPLLVDRETSATDHLPRIFFRIDRTIGIDEVLSIGVGLPNQQGYDKDRILFLTREVSSGAEAGHTDGNSVNVSDLATYEPHSGDRTRRFVSNNQFPIPINVYRMGRKVNYLHTIHLLLSV